MRSVVASARTVLAHSRDENITSLAAAVAYYAFVSIVPLFVLTLAIGSLVGGEAFAREIVREVSGLLTPTGQELLLDALTEAEGRASASVVGVLLLVWSGLRAFRALDRAFSQVYRVEEVESLLGQVLDASLVVGTLGLAAAAVVFLGGALTYLRWIPYSAILGEFVLLLVLPGAFLPLYVLFPDVDIEVREAVPGAVFAGVGWSVLTAIFQVYATLGAGASVYGLLGAALLLVTWLYVAAIVIILGAVLNAVLAGRVDDGDDEVEDSVEAPEKSPDITELARDVAAIRTRLEEQTVDRAALETDLRQYLRRHVRRNHARGWGPYLVLLYGTVMTVAAFYWLSGGWAILAMLVVWLSTLGLYVLMLAVGLGTTVAGLPGRAVEWLRSNRR